MSSAGALAASVTYLQTFGGVVGPHLDGRSWFALSSLLILAECALIGSLWTRASWTGVCLLSAATAGLLTEGGILVFSIGPLILASGLAAGAALLLVSAGRLRTSIALALPAAAVTVALLVGGFLLTA